MRRKKVLSILIALLSISIFALELRIPTSSYFAAYVNFDYGSSEVGTHMKIITFGYSQMISDLDRMDISGLKLVSTLQDHKIAFIYMFTFHDGFAFVHPYFVEFAESFLDGFGYKVDLSKNYEQNRVYYIYKKDGTRGYLVNTKDALYVCSTLDVANKVVNAYIGRSDYYTFEVDESVPVDVWFFPKNSLTNMLLGRLEELGEIVYATTILTTILQNKEF
ncbi:hypothetical protein [Fervidobacterium islandicum]|uniref:hypothetical protein n=1 Tax=Fervidobacterium islandicum TaxID=2423 RepID=UPI003A677180